MADLNDPERAVIGRSGDYITVATDPRLTQERVRPSLARRLLNWLRTVTACFGSGRRR